MKFSFAELFRRIQFLANKKDLTKEEEEELEFYNGIADVFQEIFVPGNVGSLVEIPLWGCPFTQAKRFARALNLSVVKGTTGKVYLSWPDKVKTDE